MATQTVYVHPVKYTDIDMCMEKLRDVGRGVSRGKKSKGMYDATGGVCMDGATLEEFVGVSVLYGEWCMCMMCMVYV